MNGYDNPKSADPTISRTEPTQSYPALTIKGYEVIRELHRGGQGVIYEALQRSTKRKVALKVLVAGVHASKATQRRFDREIELIAQLRHPNIISVFDSGTTSDGLPFFAMEYVRGDQLGRYVRDKDLALEELLNLFCRVCDAIQYAHQRGVIHRDLKPSNVIIDSEGNAKVVDFGLAKLIAGPVETVVTISDQVVGTLPYLSPEQARGNPDEIDSRTDIYSLGVILYELLTGHYPYNVCGNIADVVRNIVETPPTPPSKAWSTDSGVKRRSPDDGPARRCPIDDEVETIVLKAITKERDRRYQTPGGLSDDIRRYLAGEPIDAKRDSGWYVLRKTLRRHKGPVVGGAALLVIGVAIGFLFAFKYREAIELVAAKTSELLKTTDQLTLAEERARTVAQIERMVETGSVLMGQNQWADAVQQLDDVLILDPGNVRALANLAIARKELYNASPTPDPRLLEEANHHCDRAIAAAEQGHPILHRLWYTKGVVLKKLQRYGEAINAYREAISLAPNDLYAWDNLGVVQALDGDLESAEQSLLQASRLAGHAKLCNAIAWRNLGSLQLVRGNAGAGRSLSQSITCDPSDPWTYALLARLHFGWLPPMSEIGGEHEVDSSESLFDGETAVRLSGGTNPTIHRVLAVAHLRNGRFHQAIEHADLALALGDESAVVDDLILSIAHARLGHADLARRHYRLSTGHMPDPLSRHGAFIATAAKGVLWFESSGQILRLKDEAAALLGIISTENAGNP